MESWSPLDNKPNPDYLSKISNLDYRDWALDLNKRWTKLGRVIKDDVSDNPDLYSIISLPNPFIIESDLYTESYNCKTFWTIRGLLLSEMFEVRWSLFPRMFAKLKYTLQQFIFKTARGMLENYFTIIDRFGFIPIGGRVYHSTRAQAPLFAAMVKSYVDATGKSSFAYESIEFIEQEFNYWITTRAITVNGYELYSYGDESSGPRPESYREDVLLAKSFTTSEALADEFYSELKAASESGFDSSSRWFINGLTNDGDITDLHIRQIVPVELNAFLYCNAKIIAEFCLNSGDTKKAAEYESKAEQILIAIEAVLWNEESGVWLDYDLTNNIPRNYFTPTNLAPLWAMAYNVTKKSQIATSIMSYLAAQNIESYDGGVPSTLKTTGGQFDFPNVWPHQQYIIIKGLLHLDETETTKLAQRLTEKFIFSSYKAFYDDGVMYDKVNLKVSFNFLWKINYSFQILQYNAEVIGGYGIGDEYIPQNGFSSSNGIVLELLNEFGDILLSDDSVNENLPASCDNPIYCSDSVLSVLQDSNVFDDSKMFLDMSCKKSANETVESFNVFLQSFNNAPTDDQIKTFVKVCFIKFY